MNRSIIFFLVLAVTFKTWAQEDDQPDFQEADKAKDWGFSVTPYALLAAQSTDVGGERLRQSFNDLSSITNAGFQVITSLRYKRWTLTYDGTFATLGVNEGENALKVDVEIKQNISDFKLGYTVYDNFNYKENNVLHGWSLGVGVSAKYWKNDVNVNARLEIDPSIPEIDPIVIPLADIVELQEWWDLMLNVYMKFVMSPKFLLGVAYDVGGFGINNSSKFSHNITYINTFKVHKHVLINAGFRAFRYKRIDGEGEEVLETTVNVLGPLLGVTAIF